MLQNATLAMGICQGKASTWVRILKVGAIFFDTEDPMRRPGGVHAKLAKLGPPVRGPPVRGSPARGPQRPSILINRVLASLFVISSLMVELKFATRPNFGADSPVFNSAFF